jgi:hypothetical protein
MTVLISLYVLYWLPFSIKFSNTPGHSSLVQSVCGTLMLNVSQCSLLIKHWKTPKCNKESFILFIAIFSSAENCFLNDKLPLILDYSYIFLMYHFNFCFPLWILPYGHAYLLLSNIASASIRHVHISVGKCCSYKHHIRPHCTHFIGRHSYTL